MLRVERKREWRAEDHEQKTCIILLFVTTVNSTWTWCWKWTGWIWAVTNKCNTRSMWFAQLSCRPSVRFLRRGAALDYNTLPSAQTSPHSLFSTSRAFMSCKTVCLTKDPPILIDDFWNKVPVPSYATPRHMLTWTRLRHPQKRQSQMDQNLNLLIRYKSIDK